MGYETIHTSECGDGNLKTGLITLNRPQQLNALNDQLMDELGEALKSYDADDGIGCIIISGSKKAFAAGADISSMVELDYMQAYDSNFITRNWEMLLQVRKPVIAAVAGFALGGGCELAMMCDIIIADSTARFGQPEIKLGITPGAGGTQRLPRAVGKAKAMDMVLTARTIDALEAERIGLISRLVPSDELMDTALSVAAEICTLSLPSIKLSKECVNRAFELPLAEGIRFERRIFHSLFGTHDQREGMLAFLDKRDAAFRNC